MGSIVFLYLAFWMPAIAATVMAVMDFVEEKKFLEKAVETKGEIVGTLGAKHKKNNPNGIDLAGMATGNAMTQNMKGDNLGGVLVLVEFEDKKGDRYQIRSKQSFNELKEDFVSVQYDPEDPSEAIVDRYYSGKGKVFQLIAAGVLFVAPFVINYLMGGS